MQLSVIPVIISVINEKKNLCNNHLEWTRNKQAEEKDFSAKDA